jgi:hypothetical protein
MIFNSLREFFYKLYNLFLMMMLLPMILFIVIYYFLLTGIVSPLITDESAVMILIIVFPSLVVIGLTIVHWLTAKRFSVLAKQVGLGRKLEEYDLIAVVRIRACVYSSLIMAAGLFFTNHEFFGIYFGVIILWSIFIWPFPRRVCYDLKLKRDEAKMVLTKGDAFKN